MQQTEDVLTTMKPRLLAWAPLAFAAALGLGSAPAIAQESTQTVNAQTLHFTPDTLEVAAGTTVVWNNLDPFAHTVTSDDGIFDSGMFNTGESYSLTFTTPGRYQYYCIPHGNAGLSGMSGVVVVTDPAALPQPESEPAPSDVPQESNPDVMYGQ
jgi:plastocyanin